VAERRRRSARALGDMVVDWKTGLVLGGFCEWFFPSENFQRWERSSLI